MPKNTAKGQQAAYAERRTKALGLSVRGRSLPDIVRISQAEQWLPRPYNSPQAAHADINKALAQRAEQRNEMAAVYLQKELEKLDAMEEAAWRVLESLHYVVNQGELVYVYPEEQPDRIKQGWARPKLDEQARHALEEGQAQLMREPLTDNKPVLDAVTVLLKIAERRAKLLGLDAPVKKQLEVSGAGADVATRIDQLMAVLATGGPGSLTPPPATGERSTILRHPRSVSRAHRTADGADTSP